MEEQEKSRVEQIVSEKNVDISSMYDKEKELAFIENLLPDKNNIITDIRKFNNFGKVRTNLKMDKDWRMYNLSATG